MENILILDTETDGLDPKSNVILELAAILYNIPTRTVLYQVSSLYGSPSNKAFEINKISPDALGKLDLSPDSIGYNAYDMVCKMMKESDAILAHNSEFDRSFLEATAGRIKIISESKAWICTKNDVKWPVRPGTQSNLIHIAADLGVPIISAHRALTDCQLLIGCIDRVADLNSWLADALLPRSWYLASVSYDHRQQAKDAGFTWDAQGKVWLKRLTDQEAKELPFRTIIYKK